MNKKMLLWLCAALCMTYLWLGVGRVAQHSPVSQDYSHRPVIILDPGHGGEDGGAVGVDGIIEKDINLAISMQLADLFRLHGCEVIMTRESDISIHDQGVTGAKKQKTSDLHNRLALFQEHPGAIVLSIHQNKFPEGKYSGGQVFYGVKELDSSKLLAQCIQTNIKELLQPGNTREIKEAYTTLFLMQKAPMPAVLVECGFLSNPEEAALLISPEYQRKMAFVIFASTMQYMQNQ